jgi:hypothetical protein
MELWKFVEQATTPLGFDPYAVAMGARNNALNQEQQRTQNAVSALNLGREQALQGIAPQIGQAFADSGMPMGSILGQMVSADPRLASMGFREAMDYEQQKIRNAQLLILAKPEVQEVLKNVRDDILTLQQIERDVTNGLNRDKVVEQASLYQTALNELTFAKQELAKYGANASMIDQNIPKFTPYMTLFKDILTAQQQVEAGKRADAQLVMDQEMFPIEKDYKQAQADLARVQAGDVERKTKSDVLGDMDPYTKVMDESASTGSAMAYVLGALASGDPQLIKAAKADVVKRVSRQASNEALNESDFARAAGAENWKSAVDSFLKTDLAQMDDKQAKEHALRLYNAVKSSYELARKKAQFVSGGNAVIANTFPSLGGGVLMQPNQGGGGGSNNKPNTPKRTGKVAM